MAALGKLFVEKFKNVDKPGFSVPYLSPAS